MIIASVIIIIIIIISFGSLINEIVFLVIVHHDIFELI